MSTVLTNSFAGRLLPKVRAPRGRPTQMTLTILNMHCDHCLASIKDAACKFPGVEDVTGDPARQTVMVAYREGVADPDGIRTALIERGFHVADSARH